ncbi:MAG: PhoH family protein [Acidobacteria bacterium]|nr:PhoH family protein [Acidobacteriota bacterium]MBI3663757.1 PhoH family protein [Acidobacteriota bacterium]
MKRTVQLAGGIEQLYGTLDENVKLLESSLRVTTHLSDDKIEIEGEPAQVERAARILDEYNQLVREGHVFNNGEVKSLFRLATQEPDMALRRVVSPERPRHFGKKNIAPKSPNQRRYMECMEKFDMVFAIGPGGTGKTYLAVAMAVSALLTKQVSRIILARPAVEAGERLGFLPGTLQQKVDPYMRPLYDALYDMLDADKLERYLEKGIIEVAPLAFMRGRTLNESFVILDEAQNTTSEQMKMFLTRLGFDSKAVITGDITQIDLPADRRSGMIEAIEVVGKVEGIAMVYFDEHDVVRHNLVQRIIRAYETFEGAGPVPKFRDGVNKTPRENG